ncbi:MAG: hypothetical protein JXR67_01835 [Bacteroidales bacterium]|nr:hypothetical protein [Bacteroidales bacterium]
MEPIENHPLYKAHTIDSAMNSLWDFYKKRFVELFLISFAMGLAMQYLGTFIRIDIGDYQTFDMDEMMNKLNEFKWPMIIFTLVNVLFAVILQYFVMFNPLDRECNFLKCAVKSLRYYIPYLLILVILAFVGSFALFLGLILLFVGALFAGVYIMTLYLFILPIMMVEGPIIAHAIVRTATLAHRNFWNNLGWTAVFIILLLVISILLSGLVLLPFTGSFLSAVSNPEEATIALEVTTQPLYIILSAVVNAITLPLLPVFSSILYFNARAREAGRNL